jgi:hypothetical protein
VRNLDWIKPPRRLHSKDYVLAGCALLLGFIVRLSLALTLTHIDLPRAEEPVRVAMAYEKTGVLANPYKTPTGPTAHLVPLYPLALATLYRWAGTGYGGAVAQVLVGCFASALRSTGIVFLAAYLGLPFRTSFIAALMSVFYVSALGTEVNGAWDAPWTALVLMGWTAVAAKLYRSREFQIKHAVHYGVLIGLSILLSTSILPAVFGFCVTAFLILRGQRVRVLCWSSVLALAAVGTLAPWALRNKSQLGQAVWLRSNAGLELWTAYHEGSEPANQNDRAFAEHPSANEAESEKVARMGEIAYNRECAGQALRWIASHPQRTIELFLWHVVYFWFFPELDRTHMIAMAGLTLISVAGWLELRRENRFAAILIVCIWFWFPLIYYVMMWSSRYRYPMEWTLLLTSAVLITRLPYCDGKSVFKIRPASAN